MSEPQANPLDVFVSTPVEISKIPFVSTKDAPTQSQVATKDVVASMTGGQVGQTPGPNIAGGTTAPASKDATPRDFENALLHLADVKKYYVGFTRSEHKDGRVVPHKHGVNPYFNLQDIKAIESAIDIGDKSQALVDRIMKLQKIEPTEENLRKHRKIG